MKKNCVFLKWVGGKYLLVDDIWCYLLVGDCLIELFVGVGLVFFNIEYEFYILVDINSDLINFYNIVKDCIDDFVWDVCVLFIGDFNNFE